MTGPRHPGARRPVADAREPVAVRREPVAVLRELVAAGVLPRATRWQPVIAGWLLATLVLAWRADDAHGPLSRVTLLRIVIVLLATGVVNLLDDGAANVLAPVPVPLACRTGVRIGLAVAAVAAPWAAALLWVRPGPAAAGLSLECAALVTVGLAVASAVGRWWSAREAGLAGGPAVLGAAAFAALLPPRWGMYVPPGLDWRDAHVRWAAMLGVALAVLVVTLRDPAAHRWPRPG